MATEFGTGMREETARELERVRREVLMAKQELSDRFEYYFRVLRDKHLEMEARLDEVVRVAEAQVTDRQTKMNQLTIAKAETSRTLQHNELSETLQKVSQDLKQEIKRVEAVVDKVPIVSLEWRNEWLEGGMRELCRVCEGVSYVHRQTPVWTGVSKGKGRNELSSPFGLVTDRGNGEVFVCDMSNRIQVYDKDGNYQRSLGQGKFLYPDSIAITPHQLFVSCSGTPCRIFKLDKLSGNVMSGVTVSEEQLKLPYYFCLDRHFNIIVSNWDAHNIKVFSLEGDLIATIGHEGTGPGEFYKPTGIDVDKDGRIVVADEKTTHKLQFF